MKRGKGEERPGMIKRMVRSIYSSVANYVGLPYGSGYNALDPTRKLIESFSNDIVYGRSTANELLTGALGPLRAYCRNLERNNPTARAGIEALVALVVGSGIALEPETDDERFKQIWREFCEHAGSDGSSIYEMQRRAFRDIPAAGEGIWRFIPTPGGRRDIVPLRLLGLESEWLIDEVPQTEVGKPNITYASGIELDAIGNPVAYWLRRPDGYAPEERVPARSIVHMYEHRRSLQARGEPWFAPLIETLINERELTDAELYAAKMTAAMAIIVKSNGDTGTELDNYGDPAQSISPGTVARIFDDEEVQAFSHTRPSQQISPFRDMLRGDIASALRIPRRFLDRDVSKANYSSMRADMIDEMQLLYPVRDWFGHQSIGRVYKEVAPYIAAFLGMDHIPADYRLLPDGQPYVDPQKDIAAATSAISSGLSTEEAEIAKRGGDARKVREVRNREKLQEAADQIALATAVQKMANEANAKTEGLNLNWSQIATSTGAEQSPASYLSSVTASQVVQDVGQGASQEGASDESV